MQYRISIIILLIFRIRKDKKSPIHSYFHLIEREGISFESFHEQLPLPVPCYDLLPVIELAVDRREAGFGHSRLP